MKIKFQVFWQDNDFFAGDALSFEYHWNLPMYPQVGHAIAIEKLIPMPCIGNYSFTLNGKTHCIFEYLSGGWTVEAIQWQKDDDLFAHILVTDRLFYKD